MPQPTSIPAALADDFYESLVQSSDDAIISKSLDGIVQSWNPGAERLFGYTADEMIGQSLLKLFPPERLNEEGMIIEQIKQGKHVLHFETQRLRKDGKRIDVSVTISPIYDHARQVVGASKIARDITERTMLEAETKRQARFDYLTGACNRRYFMQQAEQEFNRTARYRNDLSLMMMDVDFFKRINDSFGHAAGDIVLKALADISLKVLREVDSIGRIGGEEFAILLRETGQEGATNVAERLLELFAAERISVDGCASTIGFTVSIGLTGVRVGDKSIDALLKRADQALYAAKGTGRNKVCVASME